jgi:hypothetical protein
MTMPNKVQMEQPKDETGTGKREALIDLITEQVISALGRPTDLRDVQVKKLWSDHYRVNVLVGMNAGAVRVANSFFVVINAEGGLVTATPKITKQY